MICRYCGLEGHTGHCECGRPKLVGSDKCGQVPCHRAGDIETDVELRDRAVVARRMWSDS